MAHKVCHAIEPSYEVWNDFIEDKIRVLYDDAPVQYASDLDPVETPDQALEMFDLDHVPKRLRSDANARTLLGKTASAAACAPT